MQNIIWLYFIKKIIQKNIEKNLDCKWERQYLCSTFAKRGGCGAAVGERSSLKKLKKQV